MPYPTGHVTVFGDGAGRIYTKLGAAAPVRFPYDGHDPSLCWGGYALIYTDPYRNWVWVTELNPPYSYYGLGVRADRITRPQLAGNNSLYLLNAVNALGMYDIWVCGGGGYGLTRLVQNAAGPGTLNYEGDILYCTGWSEGTYKILKQWTNGLYYSYLPYTPINSDFPHIISPSPRGNELVCVIGNFTGVDWGNPATYKRSDIAISLIAGGRPVRLGVGGPGYSGYTVSNPSWWFFSDGVIYDFVSFSGCGIRAKERPYPGSADVWNVYANKFKGTAQLSSLGANRVGIVGGGGGG